MCFKGIKYGFCNTVVMVEQLLQKSDQKMFPAIQNPEHSIHTLLAPSKDSDRSLRPSDITTNYQWLPESYIINRLFSVPFSNTYDDSVLVFGIASVFCVSTFTLVFLLFCSGFTLTSCVGK